MVAAEVGFDSKLQGIGKTLDTLLSSQGPTDLCRRIVHAGFAAGLARGCGLFLLDHKSSLKPIASYGIGFNEPLAVSAWDDSPLSEAVRVQKVVSAPVLFDGKEHSILAIPLIAGGVPRGLAALVVDSTDYRPEMSEELFEIVSRLGAFYLQTLDFGSIGSGSAFVQVNPEDLTSRQIAILGHIESGLVNLEIAKILMLSESTIRQETVRIYRALGVANRQEAAKKARLLGLLPKANSLAD